MFCYIWSCEIHTSYISNIYSTTGESNVYNNDIYILTFDFLFWRIIRIYKYLAFLLSTYYICFYVFSVVELMNQDGGSGLSVLRTFRLLRILKLVRFMPALQRQLIVMLRTMDNVATFFALLLLFMFIFR